MLTFISGAAVGGVLAVAGVVVLAKKFSAQAADFLAWLAAPKA
jgi:hypothetical protein